MFRVSHLEIDIACQIVGQKPQPQFECDQPDGVSQIGVVIAGEKAAGLREVAL